jgi:FKBP-type peptidyl-prolyl cis-trans isomerase FklB
MRNSLVVLIGLFCCFGFYFAEEVKAVELTAQADKQGYSIGYQLGADFLAKKIQVNPESLAAGMKEAMAGAEPSIDKEQMRVVLAELQKQVEETRRLQFNKLADDNKLAGEKFLAENRAKEGVTTLASGLQYKIIKAGEGKTPTADSKVTVNYRGALVDGTEFDSSYQRGQAATFPVNRVIAGWTEALQLMPVGSKWLLYVPSAIGYGERGNPPRIGPNQALVFEVELLSFE